MDARNRAIEAIRQITPEGAVRSRAISAVGQIETSGEPFKLFLQGTRRQGDAVLKVLRDAGIIETAAAAKPGIKAYHRAQLAFRDARDASEAEPEQKAHEDGARLESSSGYAPTAISYDELYAMLPAVEATWTTPASFKVRQLRARAAAAGIETEGKIGAAVDTVLWTVALFHGVGVSFADFSLEGAGITFSERTLKSAIAQLVAAEIVKVEGSGPQARTYSLVD